ncbi:MAG TPA: copper resistance protein CopC [Burkholderiales bacterium]|nr:copper resistance protein CopC [Burkholderiales bacterium]
MNTVLRLLACLAIACVAPLAMAHAFLDHASPRVGSEVHGAPAQVTLWFTQDLEPAFSSVSVTDAKGGQVSRGDAQVDASDRSILRVSLPPLPAGTYKVRWRVLSVDTHVTEGDFTFKVAPQ